MRTETKRVIGFPDYTISTDGTLVNTITGYVKKFHVGANGYKAVSLVNNGYTKTVTLHRLLAIHFIPNPENKRVVNHIDGVKTNNNIDNLEWVTDSENSLHAYRTGLSYQIKLHSNEELLKIFDRFKEGESFESISKELGCATSAITVNLRKTLSKLGLENELDYYIRKNKDTAMKQAGVDKRDSINLKMIDKKSLKVLKTFNSLAEATHFLKRSSSGPISNAVSKRSKSAFGYYWVNSDDSTTDYTNTSEHAFWKSRNTRGSNKYVGIRLRKDTGKYSCKIREKALGCYSTEAEALQARNAYAIENNMPEEIQN